MKRIASFITTYAVLGLVVLGLAAMPVAVATAAPADEVGKGLKAAGSDDASKSCGPDGAKRVCSLGDRVGQVINVLLFLIGAISVIMIIIGGFRYVVSNGDSSQITAAKNTIQYAVIGLVVALLAFAIVGFVISSFK